MVKVFTFTVFHAVQSAAYTMEMCAVELHGFRLLRQGFRLRRASVEDSADLRAINLAEPAEPPPP